MLNLELEMGDWATWVGSIGTIGALWMAFWQIHKERTHRKKRDIHEAWIKRREHVDRVSAWISGDSVHVNNATGHPIHDVIVSAGDKPLATWDLLPPGDHRLDAPDGAASMQSLHVEFVDVRGDRWHREPGKEPALVT